MNEGLVRALAPGLAHVTGLGSPAYASLRMRVLGPPAFGCGHHAVHCLPVIPAQSSATLGETMPVTLAL